MNRSGMFFVLFGALAWGQAAAPQAPAGSLPATPAAPQSPAAAPEAEVAPNAPVITIDGVCDHPTDAKDAACKTVVTRSEFEDAIRAIQPTIPPQAQRRQFASRYAMLVIFADQAHKQGLDKGPKFEEQMKLTRMEVAARTLGQDMQEKAASVSDKEVSDYYQAHLAQYETADVQQLFIPHSKAPEAPTKPGPPPTTKAPSEPEGATRKEVEALHARAVAGEDFAKLQADAYTFAGMKTRPPETTIKDLRRGAVTPNRAIVFDLKPGEVSKVISDPTGYFIFKMVKPTTAPIDKVRPEIEAAIKSTKMQSTIQSIEHAATPKFDEAYFGPASAAGPPGMPGSGAMPMTPQGVPGRPPAPTTR